ncbi:Transposon Ty3-I Gag-Pol polyprotein [Labeo rohita]|uniref:Transposon Ty3-I Gag-Pol polyprotein n=1 Tax=Labeo rohita TaxID=84645 RepID=A0ABQ8KZY6_LABRO|nr:Transposon Ty3-I Gag-Pol polyprotein [Labeo rohita]
MGSPPIKQHPHRVYLWKREVMKGEVDYLLRNGLAVLSLSAWSSPCLLVPKADGTFRFCTDYRKLNSVTKPNSFPLPRMEDCIDRVGAASYVPKLDLLKGKCHLLPVPLLFLLFVMPDNFLQYTVMAFGMRNAPATYQQLMQRVYRA